MKPMNKLMACKGVKNMMILLDFFMGLYSLLTMMFVINYTGAF